MRGPTSQVELDPAKRRDLAQKVWNKVYDQVYQVDKPTAFAISVYQPWIRGLRTGRGIGSRSALPRHPERRPLLVDR
ncbi:MAG: hypothetical protein U0446_04335 [Dehalococcoidia bacterium]